MAPEFEDRKRLTFEQAEGAAPLPSQLKPKQISTELRARLWAVMHGSLCDVGWDYEDNIGDPWYTIMQDKHVYRDHRFVDDFQASRFEVFEALKNHFATGDYLSIFGFLEWLFRHPHCPEDLPEVVEAALRASRAAYAVVDNDTIVPIGSEAERQTLNRAFADLAKAEFKGARAHLRDAGSKLTEGDYGGSIRDSVHAVEAVARTLEPTANTLAPALAKLEKKVRIHPALSRGFGNLYGFTSDEKGIRHPLLDEPVANVDETDALYMLGSCAAFVSYLISKARASGALAKPRK